MSGFDELRPQLRALETVPVPDREEPMFALRDPTGVSEQTLTVSGPALFILMQFDGTNTLDEIATAFAKQFGEPMERGSLEGMVEKLREAMMLEGAEFEEKMTEMIAAYRAAPYRAASYGDALGTPDEVRNLLAEMIPPDNGESPADGHVLGLVAPHLDFPRGWPCYGAAYGALWGRAAPRRVCVLGTNHFGRGTSVVATSKGFETPLGVTEVDVAFLEKLERECGVDLCTHEFDHKREHSIELQVMCLQHVFGVDTFTLVPILCPDPTGPTGMEPFDGCGIELGKFADALGKVMAEDGEDTLLVAGADLSHVGSQFGDDFQLDAAFLKTIELSDLGALAMLEKSRPDAFVEILADKQNPTRVCSAGCIYVVGQVLRSATPKKLGYHQAFTEEQQICVSCTAMAYVGKAESRK